MQVASVCEVNNRTWILVMVVVVGTTTIDRL
jgi:hypothetical protein